MYEVGNVREGREYFVGCSQIAIAFKGKAFEEKNSGFCPEAIVQMLRPYSR
jgi:hypothetical protein